MRLERINKHPFGAIALGVVSGVIASFLYAAIREVPSHLRRPYLEVNISRELCGDWSISRVTAKNRAPFALDDVTFHGAITSGEVKFAAVAAPDGRHTIVANAHPLWKGRLRVNEEMMFILIIQGGELSPDLRTQFQSSGLATDNIDFPQRLPISPRLKSQTDTLAGVIVVGVIVLLSIAGGTFIVIRRRREGDRPSGATLDEIDT